MLLCVRRNALLHLFCRRNETIAAVATIASSLRLLRFCVAWLRTFVALSTVVLRTVGA